MSKNNTTNTTDSTKTGRTGKQKIALILTIALWVISAALIVLAAFSQQIFGEDSFFSSIFGKPGDEGVISPIDTFMAFLPSLLKCIVWVIIIFAVANLVRLVMRKVMTNSQKRVTIAKLMDSFVKYAAAIIVILLVLTTFGIDIGTLIAGAGILGLIIGLGAQSLIADIIAGLFIVFEGDYQVGDIVVIDGWRGEVREIGIRTTKIQDTGGNIKIINNSEIKALINQTKELSLATVTVGTEYGDSIERVEAIIAANMTKMKSYVVGAVEGPFYKGVQNLGASSVDLLFVAKCKETDIYQVKRDMNRAIKLIFDSNNINIPFPQIVLNRAQEDFIEVSLDEQQASSKLFKKLHKVSVDPRENVD